MCLPTSDFFEWGRYFTVQPVQYTVTFIYESTRCLFVEEANSHKNTCFFRYHLLQRHKHMSMKISVRKKYTSYHIYILIIHHQVSSTMLCLGYVQMHHWHSEVQALKFFFKRVGHFNFAKSTSIVKL